MNMVFFKYLHIYPSILLLDDAVDAVFTVLVYFENATFLHLSFFDKMLNGVKLAESVVKMKRWLARGYWCVPVVLASRIFRLQSRRVF